MRTLQPFDVVVLYLWHIFVAPSSAFGSRTAELSEISWISEAPPIANFSFTTDGGLIRRQTQQCVNTGYVSCPNIANKCCPARDTCFSNGCCQAGFVPCESRICIDPAKAKCCSGGYGCPLAYDCVGDGFCCPSGQKRCGQSSRCYSPATQQCCEGNGSVWGCLKAETCCSLGGATACVDPATEQCCPGGSCLKTNTCCGKQCCGSSSLCGADGYCTAKAVTTTSRATTTTTTSRTTTRSSAKPTESDEPEEPDEPDLPDCQLLRRDLPSGCPSECHDGEEFPVLNYEYRPGENEQIIFSMCHGIQIRRDDPRYGAQSNDPDRYNYDILTRIRGDQHRANRKVVKCGGFCAAQKKAFNDPTSLQCDEYPFASTGEGGAPALRTCVSSLQNSRQGTTLSGFYDKCIDPYPQKNFVFRIVPGCPRAREKREQPSSEETSVSQKVTKRAEELTSFSVSAWNNSLYSPFSNENGPSYGEDTAFNAVPLGNLLNGVYDIKLDSEHLRSGAVSNVRVVDNGGEEYGGLDSSTISSVSSLVLRFNITDLDEEDELPAFVVGWARSSFNMSYSATVTPTNASAIAPQGAQSTSDSTKLGGSQVAIGIVFLGLTITMLL